MRSKHLLWRWRAEAMRGELMSLDPSKMEATHVPFSPVRLRRPDLAAHPAFASSRRLLCEVGEGDVLYLPSCAPYQLVVRVAVRVAVRMQARVAARLGRLLYSVLLPSTRLVLRRLSTRVRRYWWHEVTAVPIGDTGQQSGAEGGEAKPNKPPNCGLTASINYFFAPYYRKLNGECLH